MANNIGHNMYCNFCSFVAFKKVQVVVVAIAIAIVVDVFVSG